jgi:hypothetical protein
MKIAKSVPSNLRDARTLMGNPVRIGGGASHYPPRIVVKGTWK